MRELFSSNIREALHNISFIFANEIPEAQDLQMACLSVASKFGFSTNETNKLTSLAEDIILSGEHLDNERFIMDLD